MKSMLLGVALAVSVIVSGCTGMADAMSQMSGLGVVSEKESTFDGATIIEVSPQFVHDPKHTGLAFNTYKLGARWNSKAPDHVAMIMSFSSSSGSADSAYTNLTGLDVNLNGQKYSFKAGSFTDHDNSGWNSASETIYTESQNTVVVPMELLQEMAASDDCKIRIHSTDGYEDAVFSMERRPGGQGLAVLSIREFLDRVEQKKRVIAATTGAGNG